MLVEDEAISELNQRRRAWFHRHFESGVAFNAGLNGQAFQFDGVNDIANTTDSLGSVGTIALWVKPNSLDGNSLGKQIHVSIC